MQGYSSDLRSALLELFVYTHTHVCTHTRAHAYTNTHVCLHMYTHMHKVAVIQTQMMLEKEGEPSSNPRYDSKEETEEVDPLNILNEETQMKRLFSCPLSRRMEVPLKKKKKAKRAGGQEDKKRMIHINKENCA